ncbi:hypothetical protein [Psychroflexus torquis]|uniref:hypothetical protein n=1 Tax=Psychroflexus torquis TaxID=57029 RepID=UPI0000D5340F|nr:hypothetical protein [Psychroflexus torquis]
MKLKPIKSEKDYRNALERLEAIFDSPIDIKERSMQLNTSISYLNDKNISSSN